MVSRPMPICRSDESKCRESAQWAPAIGRNLCSARPQRDACGMTDARLCHPVRVSPPRCAPERCLRHDGRAVLSFGSGRSRVARPQRDSYGMTEQYVLSPRRGLSALRTPREIPTLPGETGMTDTQFCHPARGLSALLRWPKDTCGMAKRTTSSTPKHYPPLPHAPDGPKAHH